MVTKEEREKDRAICEAAAGLYVDGDRLWRGSQIVGEIDDTERDGPFLTAACERLPRYVADAEEMDGRIEAILEAARRHETGEIRIDAEGKLPPEVSQALDNTAAAVLRIAVRILRGET